MRRPLEFALTFAFAHVHQRNSDGFQRGGSVTCDIVEREERLTSEVVTKHEVVVHYGERYAGARALTLVLGNITAGVGGRGEGEGKVRVRKLVLVRSIEGGER